MKNVMLKSLSCIMCIASLLVIQNFGQTVDRSLEKITFNQSEFIKSEPEERLPISYGIVIDTSAKMKEVLPVAVKIAKDFIAQEQPNSDFFIVDVKNTSHIELVKDFNATLESANKALDNVIANNASSLLDGIIVSGEYLKTGKNTRKVLIVISDGIDGSNTYTVEQTVSKLKEFQVELYVIALGSLKNTSPQGNSSAKNAVKLINNLVNQVGGKGYFLSSSTEADSIAQKLITDLR